jgi:hypothetical protein
VIRVFENVDEKSSFFDGGYRHAAIMPCCKELLFVDVEKALEWCSLETNEP